ncbi:MAG: hypothetical protein M0R48_03220 [Candidatus Omnitrophica bacterium]|jgi:hypothetical protein|nr:hypothetical protein [Candidatus Omnitrophota bacterium]
MMGKIFKIFLFVSIILILSLIGFRNHIFKIYLESYASKSLKAEFKIKKANLWFNSVSIEGAAVNAKDFNVIAKNITIKFKAQKEKPYLYLSDVILSDVTLKIKSLENLKNASGKKSTLAGFPFFAKPLRLNLQNINIALKDKSLEINSSFSIIADMNSATFFINDASVANLDISSQDFEISNLSLNKFRKNKYLLKIPSLRIKDKRFTDFLIPVKSNVNQLLFPRAKNQFLGANALVSAKCDFAEYDKFCFAAKFQDASFEKMVDIFASEEASFKGLFDGALKACVSAFRISEIKADFKNKGNGFINVKKESSFAFLKTYLDAASYNALIDNFKNYEYNIGIISAKKEASALNLNLDFTSDTMGKRNITVNLHDILGSGKQ